VPLQHAPGVVAVGKKFHSLPCCAPPPPDPASAARQRAALRQRISQKQLRKQQQQQQQGEGVGGPQQRQRLCQSNCTDGSGQQQQRQRRQHLQEELPDQRVHLEKPGWQQQQQQQQPITIEVDVVACGGGCWVEVKAQEAYSVDSPHWERREGGSSNHGKVLKYVCVCLSKSVCARAHACRYVVSMRTSPFG